MSVEGTKTMSTLSKKKRKEKYTAGEWAFIIFCYIFVLLVIAVSLYPIIYVVSASLSSVAAVQRNQVVFLPVGFTTRAYEVVVKFPNIISSFLNSVFYSVVGTAMSLAFTILAAYPLSKKQLKGRRFFNLFIVFTMWFGGGMIPFYLLMKDLKLIDTRFGILIYAVIGTFYMIILRSHFESLPESLDESAKLEGANDLQVLLKIILPLSKPVLAALALYYAVGKWNSFFWETLLLTNKAEDKMPMQVILNRIVSASQFDEAAARQLSRGEQANPQTIKFAAIVLTSLPIVIIYPFLQRYCIHGTLAGAVKG